nr:YxeA family protein [Enterococcus faecalis]
MIIFCLLSGGVWYMLHPQYYYVKITESGTKDSAMIIDRKKVYTYSYSLKGYDKNGREKELTFYTHPDLNRPFKRNIYLKIRYTNWKQENGYEEVKRSDIPKRALNKIEGT